MLRILSVCVLVSILSSTQSACALLFYRLRLVRLYEIFPTLFDRRNDLYENVVECEMCDLIFSTKFA